MDAKIIRENEVLFREVLKDLKEQGDGFLNFRPGAIFVPRNLDISLSIEELVEKYSGNKKFSITGFEVKDSEAIITFQNTGCLSGGGYTWVYEVENDKVKYKGHAGFFLS